MTAFIINNTKPDIEYLLPPTVQETLISEKGHMHQTFTRKGANMNTAFETTL